MRFYILILILFGALFASNSSQAGDDLGSIQYSTNQNDLYSYYQNEISALTNAEVQQLNLNFQMKLNALAPMAEEILPARAVAMTFAQANQLLEVARVHPVVGLQALPQYAQPFAETGFCFGRAMYLHLTALKMGLQKKSIQKIWAVGPMTSVTTGVVWGYHVALLVFSSDQGWLVLDPYENQAESFSVWMQNFTLRSQDQRVRFYTTDPEKFGLYSGRYDRGMLGLTLPPEEDWFKGYFVDLLKSVRTEKLSDLGLLKLN